MASPIPQQPDPRGQEELREEGGGEAGGATVLPCYDEVAVGGGQVPAGWQPGVATAAMADATAGYGCLDGGIQGSSSIGGGGAGRYSRYSRRALSSAGGSRAGAGHGADLRSGPVAADPGSWPAVPCILEAGHPCQHAALLPHHSCGGGWVLAPAPAAWAGGGPPTPAAQQRPATLGGARVGGGMAMAWGGLGAAALNGDTLDP